MVHAVIVILLHDKLGVIEVIHPGGDVGGVIVLALAGDGVDQYAALHVCAAEEADGLDNPGADPVGHPLLVDLHHRLGKHVGGVVEAQVAVEVAAEVLGGGVLDALLEPYQLHILGHHVDDDIGGQAVRTVGEPLDEVGVAQRGDAHRAALVVDLGVVLVDLKLADHVAELTQLPVSQTLGGVLVQHGDLIKGDLVHIGGKVAALRRQQGGVCAGPENHAAHQCTDEGYSNHGHCHYGRDGALLLHKFKVMLGPLALEAGGEDGAAAVDHAQQQNECIEVGGLGVQGGQLQIEVDKAHHQCDDQIDEDPGNGAAHRLARLFLPGRPLGGSTAAPAFPLETAGVSTGKSHSDISFL